MNNADLYYLNGKILALETGNILKEDIVNALSSEDFPWMRWINVTGNHLIQQTIYAILSRAGLLHLLPPEIKEHLFMVYDLNRKRNIELSEQIKDINNILSGAGIFPVYMKGAGNVIDELYRDPAERLMLDIDFLVHDEEWERAAATLLKNGYLAQREYDPGKMRYEKHYPRLYRPGFPFFVEIHRLVVPDEYSGHFSPETAFAEIRHPARIEQCYVLSEKHAVFQNFIHSQLQHKSHLYARTFLRNLHDLLMLSRKTDVFKDLQELEAYPRQKAGYVDVFCKTFSLPEPAYPYPKGYRHLYARRYDAVLRSKFFSRTNFFFVFLFDRLLPKIYRSYIKMPFRAIYNKDVRRHLKNRLKDPGIMKKQLKFFQKIFSGKY